MTRELLQQIIDDAIDECYADTVEGRLLIEKIRAELAKPEQEDHEPVAASKEDLKIYKNIANGYFDSVSKFDIRGELAAALKCWHRLRDEESTELVDFVAAIRTAGLADGGVESLEDVGPELLWQIAEIRAKHPAHTEEDVQRLMALTDRGPYAESEIRDVFGVPAP